MFSITEQASTRLAIDVCCALLASGCGGASSAVPSAPTLAAVQPTPNAVMYTLTGVVAESGRPIEAANVNAWVDQGTIGYSYMWAHGALLTNGDGRYRMTGLPAGVRVWMQVYKDGYVQQCAAGPVTVHADLAIDLGLVSKANVTAIVQSAPGWRSVSGTIVQIATTGKQSVAGAFVDFEPLEDFVAAVTFSDQSGRFALCGLPADETVRLGTSSGGRAAYADVPPGETTNVEIILP